MLDELGGDVHGVDLSRAADFLDEKSSEKAGSSADVRHGHSRLDLASGNDFVAFGKNLPAFNLELSDELFNIGVFKRLIDARTNALFLACYGSMGDKQDR